MKKKKKKKKKKESEIVYGETMAEGCVFLSLHSVRQMDHDIAPQQTICEKSKPWFVVKTEFSTGPSAREH